MNRKNKTAYRELKFVFCESCEEIHEPNINCTGKLEFGAVLND